MVWYARGGGGGGGGRGGREGEAFVQLVTYSDAEKSHGKQNRHDLL
jgi:hypothetical protein